MGDAHLFGEFTHRDPVAPGKAFDGEERLVLLRRDSVFSRRGFAETKKLAQGVAKFRQRLIVGLGK